MPGVDFSKNKNIKISKLRMQSICKRFDTVQALDNASITLRYGEVHGLLGENGAGKTTLMNILSGLYKADSGKVFIDEKETKLSRRYL